LDRRFSEIDPAVTRPVFRGKSDEISLKRDLCAGYPTTSAHMCDSSTVQDPGLLSYKLGLV